MLSGLNMDFPARVLPNNALVQRIPHGRGQQAIHAPDSALGQAGGFKRFHEFVNDLERELCQCIAAQHRQQVVRQQIPIRLPRGFLDGTKQFVFHPVFHPIRQRSTISK